MRADTEGTRRLRACVRALFSGGVWSVVLVQAGLPLLANVAVVPDPATHVLRMAAITLLLLGLLYLIAGASRALAAGREPVSIPMVLRSGAEVFVPFLWLLFKTGVLAALFVQLAMIVAVTLSGMEPAALIERITPYVAAGLAVLGFVLVYWMPIVFVDRNFALFPTLIAALRSARARLRVSGYVAFLTLAPAAVALLLDAEPPAWIAAGLNLVASVMGWIAYIYCAEWRQVEARAGAAAPASLN